MNTRSLKKTAWWLAGIWAFVCSAPTWFVLLSLQESHTVSRLVHEGLPVSAVVTQHRTSSRSCAMYFTYVLHHRYESAVSGCPLPVGKTFVALVNRAEPQTAIPLDYAEAMKRNNLWGIAFFGGVVLIVSLLILPSLCLCVLEVMRRTAKKRSAPKRT